MGSVTHQVVCGRGEPHMGGVCDQEEVDHTRPEHDDCPGQDEGPPPGAVPATPGPEGGQDGPQDVPHGGV